MRPDIASSGVLHNLYAYPPPFCGDGKYHATSCTEPTFYCAIGGFPYGCSGMNADTFTAVEKFGDI